MTKPRHRARTLRRVKVKLAGGNVITAYRDRKKVKLSCLICKDPLKGIPHKTTANFRKLTKSQKTVNRPYGGKLCTKCMRKLMIEKARSML